ncbi:SRSF protein kinase 2 [Xylographa soralifera]|nr:SRSF protein kinase 2 [Xylographa soralifera]
MWQTPVNIESTVLLPTRILTSVSRRQYRLIEQLGDNIPHIWVARSLSDNKKVVVKTQFQGPPARQASLRWALKNEIDLLSGPLSGCNRIRQLVDRIALEGSPEPINDAVFEYGDTALSNLHFREQRQLAPPQVKVIARQLFEALDYLCKQGIVHSDIKPANILITRLPEGYSTDIDVKLIDFGNASYYTEEWQDQLDNFYWRSPESWLGMSLAPAVDMWSLGAIIASILLEPKAVLLKPAGGPVGLNTEGMDNYVRSLHTLFPFPRSLVQRASKECQERISEYVAHPKETPDGRIVTASFIQEVFGIRDREWRFIQDMLKPDPMERPKPGQLLRHPWLKPVRWYQPHRLVLLGKYTLASTLLLVFKGLKLLKDGLFHFAAAGSLLKKR